MDITKVSTKVLKSNRESYATKAARPGFGDDGSHWLNKIAEIDSELARRQGERHYVLTATGQFEHIVGKRAGFTACGVEIDHTREYGDREWFHCLSCERGE